MKLWKGFLLLAGVAAAAACRPTAEAVAEGDDPLAALGAPVASARYDGGFWAREAHRESLTWKRARALCRERADESLPTCRTVTLVARWEEAPSLPPLPPLSPPSLGALPAPPPGTVGAGVPALRAWERAVAAPGRTPAPGGPR